MAKKLNNFIICTTLIFMGCTINYNENEADIIKEKNIPDSTMSNFKLIKIKNNNPNVEIESSLAEFFNDTNKSVLQNVNFKEFDAKTKMISTEGTAEIVEYFNDTEEAKLRGNLKLTSSKEDIEMSGEYLYWKKRDRKILSSIDSYIKVIKGDKSCS